MNIEIGKSYNNWTVIAQAQTAGKFECKCKCGTRREITKGNLGKVKGCGCDREYTGKHSIGGELYREPTKPQTNRFLKVANLKANKPLAAAKKFVITSSRHTSSKHVMDADELRVRNKRAKNEEAKIAKLELSDQNDYFNQILKDIV